MPTTDTIPTAATVLEHEPSTAKPIVVATDGSEASDPALASALNLARNTGAAIYVVAVHEFAPLPAFELAVVPALVEADEGRREALRRQVESQVHRVAGQDQACTIIVRDGDPAIELPLIAEGLGACALVIGVRHRSLADRIFGRETALRLMEHCRLPLLIVPAGFAHLPRRALIATDFSAASFEAGRVGLRLFETIEEVSLIHVTPSPAEAVQLYGSWREWFDEDTTRGFECATAELAIRPDIRFQTVEKTGRAAQEIVGVARDQGVDLIVSGTRGAGLLERLLVGSTARAVVHAADCAVLIVRPPANLDAPYCLYSTRREPVPRAQWAGALKGFTERNAGRRVTLEVDDPECGAQVQVTNYALLGVDFDRTSEQVEIMVGEFTGTQRHLTRNISNVRSIEILPDAGAKDWVLRIGHGKGQTLLILQR